MPDPPATSTTGSNLRAEASLDHSVGANQVSLDVPARVVIKVMFLVTAFSLAAFVVYELRGLLVQLAVAGFLAVAANPLVARLQRNGVGRGSAVGMLLVAALALVGLVAAVFVPPLVEQGDRFVDAAPGIVEDVQNHRLYQRADEQFDIVGALSDEAADLPAQVSGQLGAIFGAVAAGLLGTLTIIFLTVFLLLGGREVVEGTVRVFPRIIERRWWAIVQGAYSGIAAYVGGAIVLALLGGTTMTITALALGLPYALPLGLWMMLLVIIPLVGATIGAIPAVIVAFAAGGVLKGIVMLLLVIVYQQVENLILQPRVQGRAASLSPFVVFVAVLVGSNLLGILGALFAVPAAGVIQIVLRQIIHEQGSSELVLPSLHEDSESEEPTEVDPASSTS